MAQSTGAPALLGDVIKFKIEPQVSPTFDQSFNVKIRTVQPSVVPSIGSGEPEVKRVIPDNTTFNDAAIVHIHKVKGS